MIIMAAVVGVLLAAIALAILLTVRRRRARGFDGTRRILVPFTGGELDGRVLAAAIRVSQAERATLVPAYLLVVPLRLPPDAPMEAEVARAMPLLEAVEYAALRAGVPVDARIEKGRTPTHALQQIWEKEPFTRIIWCCALRPSRCAGPADQPLPKRASRRIGWNSSTGFPDGSSTSTCLPPTPSTMSFRNATPRAFSAALASRSSTSSWKRFQPPGAGTVPSGIAWPPPGPPPGADSTRRRSPRDSMAKPGAGCISRVKPRASA
jgi:hypothetical protein